MHSGHIHPPIESLQNILVETESNGEGSMMNDIGSEWLAWVLSSLITVHSNVVDVLRTTIPEPLEWERMEGCGRASEPT